MAHCDGALHATGTAQRLRQTLSNMTPLRFLFAGHADANINGQRTLGFTDDAGHLSVVRPHDLANMLKDVRQQNNVQPGYQGVLELVFLNG